MKKLTMLLITLPILLGFVLLQGWIPKQYIMLGYASEILLLGGLIWSFVGLQLSNRLMTEKECITLANKKMKEIFKTQDYELESFDMVDTSSNPELQKFKGFAPVSQIMWWVGARLPEGNLVELFGDGKMRNSLTHFSVGMKEYESPLTEQLKAIQSKVVYPKSVHYPRGYKRENRIKVEVKK